MSFFKALYNFFIASSWPRASGSAAQFLNTAAIESLQLHVLQDQRGSVCEEDCAYQTLL